MHPSLQFLKELNESCGNLVVAGIAVLALKVAVREYRAKNYPIFSMRVENFGRDDGNWLSLKIKNEANQPIGIKIEEVRLENKFETIFPKLDLEYVFPSNSEQIAHIHHFDVDEIRRLRGPKGEAPPSQEESSVELYLRASSQSIFDSAKRARWLLCLSIQLHTDKISSARVIKNELKTLKKLTIW